MRTLCIVAILVMLASCSPRNFPVSTETTDRVNTTIEVVLHDTLYALRLPDEQVRSTVLQGDSSYLETTAAWSRAWVEDGRLHHELGHKNREPILVPIQVPERRVTVDSTHTELVKTPVYVKKKLSWWQQTVMGAGYISLFVLFVLVVVKVLKWKKKLL